jgi:hypothetical protein
MDVITVVALLATGDNTAEGTCMFGAGLEVVYTYRA